MIDSRMTVDRDYIYDPEDGPLVRGAITLLQGAQATLEGFSCPP